MQIHGFNKSTLLDYPRHLAATIFVGGCNMACPFCHNGSLVLNPNSQPTINPNEILNYLGKRKNILEGVCISGGEPTLYKDITGFIGQIKELGYKVKLDTNGTNPTLIKDLIDGGLIDYIAMDIKNSKEKYKITAGNKALSIESIEESISFIMSHKIDYEFRTTIVNELHTKKDMDSIGSWLKGAKAYYLQPYKDSGDIISPGFTSPKKETLITYQDILSNYIENVSIRGID